LKISPHPKSLSQRARDFEFFPFSRGEKGIYVFLVAYLLVKK